MNRYREPSSKTLTLPMFNGHNLPIPRNFRRYFIIQLLVVGFIIYLWYQFNGGFVPKFLTHKLQLLDVGPDVNPLLYFGDIDNDVGKVKWSGVVNDKEKLREAVSGTDHMLEGSVILRGQNTNKQTLIPVMAEPPDTDSETTLEEWLDIVKSGPKGIKLTFTGIEAVEISLQKLKGLKEKGFLKFPVWIHVDLLKGPFGSEPLIDSTRFFRHLKRQFPKCTVSLGWTTGTHTDTSQSGYTWDMVIEMYHLVKNWDINDQPIIFNAAISYLKNSIPQLKWLCDNLLHSSLLVLQNTGEYGAQEDLLYAAYRFPNEKLFFNLKNKDLIAALTKYRHFSRDKVNPLVLKRDLVMFHPQAWVKMGFHMDKDSVLGSTEAIILTSPIVYIVSKTLYKPTPLLSMHGRVQFLNYDGNKLQSETTGLNIYLRPTKYTHYEEIVAIRCFLGLDGSITVEGSNLKEQDSFKSKTQKITPSSANCFRFEIIDGVHEVIFRVNVVHDCNTLESVRPDIEVHSELTVKVPSHYGETDHPFLLRVGDNKRYTIIDELMIQHT